jgi:hypothetical protein
MKMSNTIAKVLILISVLVLISACSPQEISVDDYTTDARAKKIQDIKEYDKDYPDKLVKETEWEYCVKQCLYEDYEIKVINPDDGNHVKAKWDCESDCTYYDYYKGGDQGVVNQVEKRKDARLKKFKDKEKIKETPGKVKNLGK